jgi:PAS domain S-box-containing protein
LIRVLHVDDDKALLELAKHFLERSGDLDIDTALSAKDAVTLLRKIPYDAIVSDYNMPGCNGIELLRHIRRANTRTPFLFFSDQGNEELVIDALTSGADFFLPKGIQIRSQLLQLSNAIGESVKRRRAEHEQDKISAVLRIKDAAVRSSLCPIALGDTEGQIQYANPASLAIWGYTDESEVVGRHVCEFVMSPEITPASIPGLLQLKTWSGQATCRRKDGSTFEARVYANAMNDETGTPLGFVASITDLSRQQHARARLESYIRDVRFVSEKTAEMTEFPLEENIFGFIADALSSLVAPGSIIILDSVHADATARVEAFRGEGASLAEIEKVIGQPLVGMTFHAPEEGFSSILAKSFIEIDGGITTLTFGQMPPAMCRKIEEYFPIGRIIGTGFFWGGKVHGVSAIILPPGITPENIDLLDLFVRHCSAVLQRREAEKILRGAPPAP